MISENVQTLQAIHWGIKGFFLLFCHPSTSDKSNPRISNLGNNMTPAHHSFLKRFHSGNGRNVIQMIIMLWTEK